MKKYFTILTTFFFISFGHGQTNVFHSFPDSAFWRVDYHNYDPFQYPTDVKYYFQYYIAGDTLINTYVYKKIFKSSENVEVLQWTLPTDPPTPTNFHYVGAFRDDSLDNKTFFIFPGSNNDSLLYDYNLGVGDTLKGIISQYPSIYIMVVTSVDSVLINGQYRKRWNFDQCNNYSPYIIEGIGTSAGVIEPLCTYAIDFYYRYLVCVKDSLNTLFVSDYNSTLGCNLVVNLPTEVNDINYFSVFPNPFSTMTTLHSSISLKAATLIVYNSVGQKVKQIKNISGQTFTLQRDYLSSGLYFLQVTQDNKILTTDKLIIKDN